MHKIGNSSSPCGYAVFLGFLTDSAAMRVHEVGLLFYSNFIVSITKIHFMASSLLSWGGCIEQLSSGTNQ